MLMNMGMFGTGMSISCEQLVMDNEMCRIARRFMRGIEVSDETIAADVIMAVGPRNMYLLEDHTIDYLRSGEHVPLDITNGANFGVWEENGKLTTVDAARRVIKRILDAGPVHPLSRDLTDRLQEIIDQREKSL